jgi:hypothetical protein
MFDRSSPITKAMRATIATLLFVAAACGAASAESYVVSPKASDATKAAIAEGRAPEHGFPVILSVNWSTFSLTPGVHLEADVETSINIDYVEGRYKDWNMAFTQTGLGKFHLSYKVPWLPPFLIGHWPIDVIARSDDGVEVRKHFVFVYKY